MLLTICPNCSAQFKVQPEQLNVRQGRVMCGRCRQVFNAFQSLTRAEEPIEAQVAQVQEAAVEPVLGAPGQDALATFFAPEPVTDPLFLREEPLPLPHAFSALESPPPPSGLSSVTETTLETSVAAVRIGEDSIQQVGAIERQAVAVLPLELAVDFAGEENPLLVAPATYRQAPAKSFRGWRVGVFVLMAGLAVQAAYAFRTTLVSTFPQIRPAFSRACEFAGCSLSWGRDESALKIEASELIEAPGKPGRILLTAILVNHGKSKQDLPSMELRLTDNGNQVVVSRILNPSDYLGRAVSKDEGLAPNIELYVNLNLELSNKPLASGYGLVVFYP